MIKEILGYKFRNPSLLQEALTHPSSSNQSQINYERLEFLGDAVLTLIITELLLVRYPEENEGKLAKRRSGLISGEILSHIAKIHNLGSYIIMTESELKCGGRDNPNNLENVLESLIGSIYLDGGIENVKLLIQKIWEPFIEKMLEVPIDPKSKLQEILQKDGRPLPVYEIIESYGPKHMLIFKVKLKAEGFSEVVAEGKSKQQAEKEAAILLLKKIEGSQ